MECLQVGKKNRVRLQRLQFICKNLVSPHLPFLVRENMFCIRQTPDPERCKAEAFETSKCLRLGKAAGDIRIFIEACQKSMRRAFAERDFFRVMDQEYRMQLDRAGLFFCPYRIVRSVSCPECLAETGERARTAGRDCIRETDRGAEIHQRLVEISGGLSGHPQQEIVTGKLFCLRCPDICRVGLKPCINAQEISVDCRDTLGKGYGCDGGSRIWTDAGQLCKRPAVRRHLPAVLFHDLDGSLMEIADPRIVAEPLPQLEVSVLRCSCERRNIRESGKKTGIVAFYGLNPGLLQHDLGKPDMIRCRILPPWKMPPAFSVPAEKFRFKLSVLLHAFSLLPVYKTGRY